MSAAAALAAARRLPAPTGGTIQKARTSTTPAATSSTPTRRPGRRVLLLEADPAELVDEHRRERLPEDDRRGERHRAELRRRDDRAGDVEGAEQPADPDPPRDSPRRASDGSGLRTNAATIEQRDRPDEERDERRADRAAEPVRELRVDAELNGQHRARRDREEQVEPDHCARRFRRVQDRSPAMALTFGVTVLPDPPYTRMIELMQFAEQQGFEYAWTYDSHILWQDSYATLPLAAAQTEQDQARPLRHEPGHPRPDDHRELVRDGARHLERPDGDGHRPRRLVAARRRAQAGEGRGVRGALRDDQGADERPRGRVEREEAEARVGAAGAARHPDVDRRLRAEGARRRGPRRRRRDHPARRPADHPVDHGHRAARRPRRPAATRAS